MSTSISCSKGNAPLLQAYAEEIRDAAEIISSYCSSQEIPHPSFHPQAPSVTIPSSAPDAVQNARRKLVASAAAAQQLATEPADYLPHLAIHYQQLACLGWLCHFDVLAHIPRDGTISYSELATATGVPQLQLRSVARMVMTSNLLCEPAPNQVAHNAVSALFISNPSIANWASFMVKFSAPVATAFAEATEKWGVTDKKNETAFNVALKTDLPFFNFLSQSSGLADSFASYMQSVQSSYGTSLKHLLSGFDWAGVGEGVVVDVGGSTCSSSITLASAFPNLTFIVEDLPDTISSRLLSAQPPSITSRISTQAYDFFTPQPIHGAAIYLLRMILHDLHDWPAADATLILQNQLQALKANPGAHLLVMDTVLPTPGSVSAVEEALLRVRDLTMMQSFNSKERERSEFEELFSKVRDEEGGLVLRDVVKPAGSVMSVMDVVYKSKIERGNGLVL
ncbi:MAG: hypothetical protein Q9195_002153 [Heterodermia aff. obscurata]